MGSEQSEARSTFLYLNNYDNTVGYSHEPPTEVDLKMIANGGLKVYQIGSDGVPHHYGPNYQMGQVVEITTYPVRQVGRIDGAFGEQTDV